MGEAGDGAQAEVLGSSRGWRAGRSRGPWCRIEGEEGGFWGQGGSDLRLGPCSCQDSLKENPQLCQLGVPGPLTRLYSPPGEHGVRAGPPGR